VADDVPQRLVVDCETGQETLMDLSGDEVSELHAACDDAAQVRAAEDAKAADAAQAQRELGVLAAAGEPVPASLMARLLGMDI
jgi:hypothetical protein